MPPRRFVPFLTLLLGLAVVAPSLSAQEYFGRNKVQYKKFDFQILKTEHFDIYYYPAEREGIDIAARMAERWHARLERMLDHELQRPAAARPLRLASRLRADERRSRASSAKAPAASPSRCRRRIVLPLGGPLADTDHVIGHELVHAFQFDITTTPSPAPGRTAPSACRCGSSRAWPSTCRSGRSIRTRRCGCATRLREQARSCRRSTISTTRSTSRIAGVRRSGRTSAAGGATT